MNANDITRFWSHVDVRGDAECWPWTSARSDAGYGTFSMGGRAGGMRIASRVAYEITNGPAGTAHVRHTCDNPPCCNPAHLILGSRADNMRDMAVRERSRTTKLTARDVAVIRTSADLPTSDLARKFGVSKSNIVQIRAGVTWKHVTAATFALLLSGGAR